MTNPLASILGMSDGDAGDALVYGSASSIPIIVASNLLRWTEALDNAAWTKGTGVSVLADQLSEPVNGAATADEVLYVLGNRNLSQLTTIVATVGTATAIITPSVLWGRSTLSATFDTGAYTLSFYMQRGPTNLGQIRLVLEVVGGFVNVRASSFAGSVDAYMTDWQLETGSVATVYQPRTV